MLLLKFTNAHSAAGLGPPDALGNFARQTVRVVPGVTYHVSMWYMYHCLLAEYRDCYLQGSVDRTPIGPEILFRAR